MTLIILVGVWALAFGHITITQSLRIKGGNEARIFGLTLIAMAAYGFPHLSEFAGRYMPTFVSSNEAFKFAYELLVGAFATYVTGWVFTRFLSRAKIPSITVSLKRRAA